MKIYKLKDGLFKRLGIPENYTIMSINRRQIKEPQEVIDFFDSYHGNVLLDGFTSSKERAPIQFRLK